MIYLLYGEEYFLLKEKIEEIKSKTNVDNIISIDFDYSNIQNILNEVCYIDLFNSKKLLIVSNFTFKKLKEEDEKALIKYFDNLNDNVIIFKCIDKSLDLRKNIVKKFNSVAKVSYLKKLDRFELFNHLKEMFKKEKYKISDELIKKIINDCGYNNYSENNNYIFDEINKLMMYTLMEKEINSKDIDDVILKNTDNEIFNLINAVTRRDIEATFDEFKIIKELDIEPTIILTSIAKQFRTLLQIKILNSEMGNDSIAKKLGLNPYAVEIISKNINLYTIDNLVDILDKIFYADEKMKSENIDKYGILEQFFIDLE